jgi:hypothetical protein
MFKFIAAARAVVLAIGIGCLLFLAPVQNANAEDGGSIWENKTNLQVLPSDISPQELRGYMVGAASGLGVRCWACHIGEEGQDLSTFDFASDDKTMKKLAREMFRMTLDINASTMQTMAKIEGHEEAGNVRCVTCHRGEVKPKLGATK